MFNYFFMLDNFSMFNNIGSKIKKLAESVCIIGIITSIIVGVSLIINDEDTIFIGFLVIILGPLLSWIGSCTTYGFGQLIENSDIIVEKLERVDECPECGSKILPGATFCANCGESLTK